MTDCKKLNKKIKRCHWPTESSGQLLKHIDPQAKYFVSLDLTSGYHQIKVDEESPNFLLKATPIGRFKFAVLAQRICSSSDIFNYLTDGSMPHDNSGSLKNMDDVLLYGSIIKEIKERLDFFRILP